MSNVLEMADAYRTLELRIGAPLEQVRSQYKRMVTKYHPDKLSAENEGDKRDAEEKLKEINAAKDILTSYLKQNGQSNGGASRHEQQTHNEHSTQQGRAYTHQPNGRLRADLRRFMDAAERTAERELPNTQPNLAEVGWIEEYDVHGYNIGDRELANLLSSPNLLRVRRLRLRNTMISDTGASLLLNLRHLEHLDLHGCHNITSRVFLTLIECRTLTRVCIRSSQITQEDAQSFARLRPDCEVRYQRSSCP